VTSGLLRHTASWLFFATLAYAPWAYGGTTAGAIATIDCLLFAVLVFWVVDLLIKRQRPEFPRTLLILILMLIAIGGWMVFNASAINDSAFAVFARVQQPAPRLTGSVDYALSTAWMIRGVLLLGIVLFIVDLSQDARWLLRLWGGIGLVAGSLALLGLLQKATGAPMIFWKAARVPGEILFFATYYYHGNAGAYLNLVLPLTAGLAVRSFITPTSAGVRALWLTVFVLTLLAVVANTSRMAQLIAMVILVAVAVRIGPRLVQRLSRTEKNVALAGAGAVLLAIFAVAQATHLEQPIKRWGQISKSISSDARWLVDKVAVKEALPEVGFFGFGPGTFRGVFPSFNLASGAPVAGTWRFLHNDYLQTVMEWGWVGSALWALLFFGGIVVAVRRLKSPDARTWVPRRRLLLALVVIALGGVALHALVDFPLQIESIQLYAATYLGLCWGSSLWESQKSEEVRSRKSDN